MDSLFVTVFPSPVISTLLNSCKFTWRIEATYFRYERADKHLGTLNLGNEIKVCLLGRSKMGIVPQ